MILDPLENNKCVQAVKYNKQNGNGNINREQIFYFEKRSIADQSNSCKPDNAGICRSGKAQDALAPPAAG